MKKSFVFAGIVVLSLAGYGKYIIAQEETAPVTEAPEFDPELGKEIYNTSCAACHASGVGGAPVLGDKSAWEPRIAQGADVLAEHAIQGYQGEKGVMPPKGGNPALTNDEVAAAVSYMVTESK